MSAESREYQDHNFAFFKEIILEPTFKQFPFGREHSTLDFPGFDDARVSPIVTAIGLIETALWLRLGIELHYFYNSTVIETLTSLEWKLSAAWTTIVKNEVILPDEWCDFMSGEPEPRFMEDQFLSPSSKLQRLRDLNIPEYVEQMRRYLLGCLLLTSEVIFDPRVLSFLVVVGWGSDELLEKILGGYPGLSNYSPEDIYLGFANHVTYFERLDEYLSDNLFRTQLTDVAEEPWYHVAKDLKDSVMTIVSARQLLLHHEQAKIKCLRLGGNIAAMLYQPLPQWQRSRQFIFWTVWQAIGFPSMEKLSEYWSYFASAAETTRQTMREVRPESSSHSATE